VVGSQIALWHALITSGRFGFEREVVEKFIIDEIPVPVFEDLSLADRRISTDLFETLAKDDSDTGWQRVDHWVGRLFGLTPDDVETIADTLRYRLPFSTNLKASQVPVTHAQHLAFNKRLNAELQPWGERFGQSIGVRTVSMPPLSPWQFVLIGNDAATSNEVGVDWMRAVELADKLSATEVIYVDEQAHRLVLGRLNQARYWTPSQARLAARRIVWEHIDFLTGDRAQ
jgi:hypothetical protein